jgi:hypothetical protein
LAGLAGLAGARGPRGPRRPRGSVFAAIAAIAIILLIVTSILLVFQFGEEETLNSADFFTLISTDDVVTVAPGIDVGFPLDGPVSGSTIVRTGLSSFTLTEIGTYQILFQVSAIEAGQLILTLNGVELDYTIVGSAGDSQIVGMALVDTTGINSTLTVRNPVGSLTDVILSPLDGETTVSAHLVIVQVE